MYVLRYHKYIMVSTYSAGPSGADGLIARQWHTTVLTAPEHSGNSRTAPFPTTGLVIL